MCAPTASPAPRRGLCTPVWSEPPPAASVGLGSRAPAQRPLSTAVEQTYSRTQPMQGSCSTLRVEYVNFHCKIYNSKACTPHQQPHVFLRLYELCRPHPLINRCAIITTLQALVEVSRYYFLQIQRTHKTCYTRESKHNMPRRLHSMQHFSDLIDSCAKLFWSPVLFLAHALLGARKSGH